MFEGHVKAEEYIDEKLKETEVYNSKCKETDHIN
jgi:hypothetical protein